MMTLDGSTGGRLKTGILSMHRISNHGSFLQAFALKGLLEHLGCDVAFVDYIPGRPLIANANGSRFDHKVRRVLRSLLSEGGHKSNIRHIWHKATFQRRFSRLLGVSNELNLNTCVDLLVIGSDEVFNCVQANPDVGYTPALFGKGIAAGRKISYAASFGHTTLVDLQTQGIDAEVGSMLKGLDSISVRDGNSEGVVAALTGQRPEVHFDPVLIYDYLEHCRALITPPKSLPPSYLLLYGYDHRFTRRECQAILSYAEKKGLRVVCIGGVQDCCDEYIDCTPFEVIGAFENATEVITDTFHGTILSTITRRPFAAFVRTGSGGNEQKLSDLMVRLGLESRRVYQPEDLSSVMVSPINFDVSRERIVCERKKSVAYLKKEIEKAKRCQ